MKQSTTKTITSIMTLSLLHSMQYAMSFSFTSPARFMTRSASSLTLLSSSSKRSSSLNHGNKMNSMDMNNNNNNNSKLSSSSSSSMPTPSYTSVLSKSVINHRNNQNSMHLYRNNNSNSNSKMNMNRNNMQQSQSKLFSSSYDSDEDFQDATPFSPLNGDSMTSTSTTTTTTTTSSTSTIPNTNSRYSALLQSCNLNLHSLEALPDQRTVSASDVFCNRELNLEGVRAIGFDMDYTLAQYHQPAFDKLAFDGAKEKLVHAKGYPAELLDIEYDHSFWARGLIIDTVRGNFLKIDRHKYVRVAYHGFTPMESKSRKFLYSRNFNKVPSFTEKQYVNMDTLFQFVDACLFANLIEMKDKGNHEVLDYKTYNEIYKEVRECIDLCHRDGVIKDEVARNPEKYIVLDNDLIPMLQQFRNDGVKVFLLTNSYWEYTSDAMNYLYHKANVDDETKLRNEWTDFFDLVIVGSCKPAYLVDPYLNLFRVNPADGSLLNTDGIFEIEALGENGAQKFLEQGKIFQGGNWKHLTKMLEIEAGEEILYVGDHLYSDVLRSKRSLGWRSMFIIPEIVHELETFHNQIPLQETITELRKLRDELSNLADQMRLQEGEFDGSSEKLEMIRRDDEQVKAKLSELAREYHAAFHPVWGMLFQAGFLGSRMSYFVQNYACLYTAKATNLAYISSSRSFRTSAEMLPHDKLLADETSTLI